MVGSGGKRLAARKARLLVLACTRRSEGGSSVRESATWLPVVTRAKERDMRDGDRKAKSATLSIG